MKAYLITAIVFAVAWLVAWFAFIRPTLKHYALTAGVLARIEAVEGNLWAKIKIWLEGKKSLAFSFLLSGFAAAKGASDHVVSTVSAASNLDPSALVPLQDKGLWATLFSDALSFRIVAAVSILMTILHIKGLLTAAKIVPADKA